jgi:hypothetical protein
MKNIVIAAVSALLFSCPVLAQQTLLGKYSGTYSFVDFRGDVVTGISLEILGVDGDKVSAKAVRASGSQRGRSPCVGEYQLEGKVKGDALVLKSITSPAAGDCSLNMTLTVDGNRLVGTINKGNAQLSK